MNYVLYSDHKIHILLQSKEPHVYHEIQNE